MGYSVVVAFCMYCCGESLGICTTEAGFVSALSVCNSDHTHTHTHTPHRLGWPLGNVEAFLVSTAGLVNITLRVDMLLGGAGGAFTAAQKQHGDATSSPHLVDVAAQLDALLYKRASSQVCYFRRLLTHRGFSLWRGCIVSGKQRAIMSCCSAT